MNEKQFDLLLDQFKQLNNSIGEIATHLTSVPEDAWAIPEDEESFEEVMAQYLEDGDTVRIVRLGVSTDEEDDIEAGLKVGNIYKVSLPGPKDLNRVGLVALLGTEWPSEDGCYSVLTNQVEKVD